MRQPFLLETSLPGVFAGDVHLRGIDEDIELRLPAIVGGLSVALARTFGIIEPSRRTPGPSTGNASSASSTCC